MLKTGIVGADTPQAGELMRLLVNHPDVDIRCAVMASQSKRKASDLHHGLIGESDIEITDGFDPSKLDVVFLCHPSASGTQLLSDPRFSHLKLIDLSGTPFRNYAGTDMEYGLGEINRKALVRGATRALVPHPAASLILTALYPPASHLLLSDDLEIDVELPADLNDSARLRTAAEEIATRLRLIQSSFTGDVKIDPHPGIDNRAMRMRVSMRCATGLDEVIRVYDGIYDDHNFTYITTQSPDAREVVATQKCLIGLSKPDQWTLRVEAVADSRLRGGAGDALHVMNLLCGLHERTGLRLKTSAF